MPLKQIDTELLERLHRLQDGQPDNTAGEAALALLPLVGLTPATLLGPVQLWPHFPQRKAAEDRVEEALAAGTLTGLDAPTPRGVLRRLRELLREAVDPRLRFRLPGSDGAWLVGMPSQALEAALGREHLWDPDFELADRPPRRRARRAPR